MKRILQFTLAQKQGICATDSEAAECLVQRVCLSVCLSVDRHRRCVYLTSSYKQARCDA